MRKKKRETKVNETRMQTTRQDVNNLRRRRRRRRRVIKPAPPGPRRSPFRPIRLPFDHPQFAATFVYTCAAEARLTALALSNRRGSRLRRKR